MTSNSKKVKFSHKGIPILPLSEKLEALKEMMLEGSFEDAAGHLCDLLEYLRTRIVDQNGMIHSDLVWMVRHYGMDPTPIQEENHE